jgi:hypothetical protein
MTAKIKTALGAIALVIVAVIIGVIAYAGHQRTLYNEAIGASKILTAEFEAYRESADASFAGLNASINAAIVERAKASAVAQSQAATQAALDKLKTETAALPATDLIIQINARIGSGNSWPTAGGLFSFTRVGTENTLNLFYTGEAYYKQYTDEQKKNVEYKAALDKDTGIISAWTEKYTLRDGEYQLALKAWDGDREALKHLSRSIFGRKVKAFVIGAGIGAAAVIIYNLIKPSAAAIDGVAIIKEP